MPLSRRELANVIRALSMDAVQQANSGHPGMPMGMADIAEVLWNDFLKHNPGNPDWPNRDRFILSNGHGCMLQYALLHLTGYALTLDDIKHFRQLHSKTPGHPELGDTPGVEVTTGPLGQGLANGVGMAIAEKHLAKQFNQPGFPIVDHYTYVFVGDGCLMEGISHEACSLAGTLGLGKLIVFYDDNGISIDGEIKNWFTDNTPLRFESYGWHVISKVNGHDSDAIKKAIEQARSVIDKPSIICCQTQIGWGAPQGLVGTAGTHGAPLGLEAVSTTRKNLNWTHPPFVIPENYYQAWDARIQGKLFESTWDSLFSEYSKKYPDLAKEYSRRIARQLPQKWSEKISSLIGEMQEKHETIATRKASNQCLQKIGPLLSELIGGSADLTESNLTEWSNAGVFSKNHPEGRYIHYGVREFGMTAILNGMAAHGGLLPFGGTFLTFSDYARNAIRLASMMKSHAIFVYTHDSIGLGEDGPTHQPIEHITSLRLMPQLSLWRPCDPVETAVAWQQAIEHRGPTCLLLTRQALPCQNRTNSVLQDIKRGGYILKDCVGTPELIIMATGSEVSLAMDAAAELSLQNRKVRVVSLPSTDCFLKQDAAYQEKVLPKAVTARLAIEAGASNYWYQWVGCDGKVLGLDHFGASAPAKDIFKECGFTVENAVKIAKSFF